MGSWRGTLSRVRDLLPQFLGDGQYVMPTNMVLNMDRFSYKTTKVYFFSFMIILICVLKVYANISQLKAI